MNIFVTDQSPVVSAQNLDDKRVIKMLLESAQLLSTAIFHVKYPKLMKDSKKDTRTKRKEIAKELGIYTPTHINHPCSIWSSKTQCNWLWLFDHYTALCSEYTKRFNKVHKSQFIVKALTKQSHIIPDGNLQPFQNCAANESKGISFKHIEDTIDAYRLYCIERWKTDSRTPKWTNTVPPSWAIKRGIYDAQKP